MNYMLELHILKFGTNYNLLYMCLILLNMRYSHNQHVDMYYKIQLHMLLPCMNYMYCTHNLSLNKNCMIELHKQMFDMYYSLLHM